MSDFNALQGGEANAVYLGFVWELCRGLCMYAAGAGASPAPELGLDYELIRWTYAVEVEEGPELGQTRGFVPARTGTRWELIPVAESQVSGVVPTAEELEDLKALEELLLDDLAGAGLVARPSRPAGWDPSWSNHAALYTVPTFEALRTVQATTLADAASSVDIYAVTPGGHPEVVRALRVDNPPRMADLLRTCDGFVSLNVGVDMDYSDVVLVQSSRDIGDRIDAIAADFDQRIADYEATVGDVADMPALLAALARLAGVG